MLYCLSCAFTSGHLDSCTVTVLLFSSSAGNCLPAPPAVDVCSSVMQRQIPAVNERHSLSVTLHPGEQAHTACIRVPQYLCHKSMALVTMASVFSCGIWEGEAVVRHLQWRKTMHLCVVLCYRFLTLQRNLTTPSGRLIPINTIL